MTERNKEIYARKKERKKPKKKQKYEEPWNGML